MTLLWPGSNRIAQCRQHTEQISFRSRWQQLPREVMPAVCIACAIATAASSPVTASEPGEPTQSPAEQLKVAEAQTAQSTTAAILTGTWAGAVITEGTPLLFEITLRAEGPSEWRGHVLQIYDAYSEKEIVLRHEAGAAPDGVLLARIFGGEMRLTVDLGEQTLRGLLSMQGRQASRVFLRKVLARGGPRWREEALRFRAGEDLLSGTLLLPGDVAKPAVAVMVTGRGYGPREEMLPWAQLLARSGIGALVFDSRGTGSSTRNVAAVTAAERFEEVHAALNWLLERSDIGSVGLLGNSAAGWIVPTIAASRRDVAFVVTLVGPVESLADQQGHVTVEFMRAAEESYSEADYAAAFAYQRQTVLLAQSNAPWSAFEEINGPARAASWAKHALIPAALDDEDLDYFRRRVGFDAPPWDQLRVPVLALFGESDPVVPPAVNVPLLRDALRDNPDATVVVIPNADHSLKNTEAWLGDGDWPHRWYRQDLVHPSVFQLLSTWFEKRFPSP